MGSVEHLVNVLPSYPQNMHTYRGTFVFNIRGLIYPLELGF